MISAVMPEIRETLSIEIQDLSTEQRDALYKKVHDAYLHIVNGNETVILGWTAEALHNALGWMENSNGKVQADVIRYALKNHGHITRGQVYKIGHYPKARTLTGFTKPVSRVVKEMKAAGHLPDDASDLLWTSYQDGVKADGFSTAAELAELL